MKMPRRSAARDCDSFGLRTKAKPRGPGSVVPAARTGRTSPSGRNCSTCVACLALPQFDLYFTIESFELGDHLGQRMGRALIAQDQFVRAIGADDQDAALSNAAADMEQQAQ